MRTISAVFVVLAMGCNKGGGDAGAKEKEAYQKSISDVREMVGVISAFMPHLEPAPLKGTYAPKVRPDFDRAATFAANGIRSAANRARQNLQKQGSTIADKLAEPFVAVTKVCADAKDPDAVGKCKASVNALDAALQEAGGKAAAAGVTDSFPRIGAGAVNETGNKEMAPLVTAMGGGKAETAFYAKLEDANATSQDVVDGCQAAEDETKGAMKAVEKIDEEARKVAAVHNQMIVGVCAKVGRAEMARANLESCIQEKEKKKKLSKEREEECNLSCTAGKAVIEGGIPAATFEKIKGQFKDFCEKDEDKKK
jgi:hypothetical protein